MKKISLLLLVVVIVIGLFSCGGNKNDETDIWALTKGIWVSEIEGVFYFVYFHINENNPYFSEGIMFSGFATGGEAGELKKIASNRFNFDVSFPAVAPNEENSGHEAYTKIIMLDINSIAEGKIYISGTEPGETVEFVYAGEDFSEANEYVSAHMSN